MQLHFGNEGNLYDFNQTDSEFQFPVNIKQMGAIENEIKIYMEDYVYTYLYQYAKTGGSKEKLAALVGKHTVKDGQEIVLINGAIQGKHTSKENGVETFTQETWKYINDQMDIYFKGLSIVGWVHIQPCFGAFLMNRDEIFHKSFFPCSWQVLYVLDPIEKLDAFYIHNKEKTALREAKGYFIYYSKNEEMHDYMLDNALVKPKLAPHEMPPEKEEPILSFTEKEDNPEEEKTNERIDAAPKIRKVLRQKAEEEENIKRKYTYLAGISGVLCLSCLIMGANLIHSQSRLKNLESEFVSVKTSYSNLEEQFATTQMVFAAQTDKLKEKEEEEKNYQAMLEEMAQQKETASKEPSESAETTKPSEEYESLPTTTLNLPEYYVVEDGDTLGYISQKFYGTNTMMDKIMEANNLDDPNKIISGKKLILPKP